jgi:hypothetical protein
MDIFTAATVQAFNLAALDNPGALGVPDHSFPIAVLYNNATIATSVFIADITDPNIANTNSCPRSAATVMLSSHTITFIYCRALSSEPDDVVCRTFCKESYNYHWYNNCFMCHMT